MLHDERPVYEKSVVCVGFGIVGIDRNRGNSKGRPPR